MTTTVRVVTHVWRAAETRKTAAGHGGGVGVAINLQGGADKHIYRVLASQLAEGAVRTHRAVGTGKEDVWAGADILFHPQLAAEAVHAFYPAALNCRNQRWMRVQGPVLTDFAFQTELFTVGWQQQFNRRGVEADTVVQRLYLMFRVDAFNRHHRHQDVFLFDQAWVAGKQRFDKERFVGDNHVVNPGTRNIHARQIAFVVHQLVHLCDDDTVVECSSFHQRRGIFGTRPGVEVTFTVSFITGNQRHVRGQVNIKTGIEFDVGVDGADFQLAIFQ